jgi:outer membrane lipoprotein SlyB
MERQGGAIRPRTERCAEIDRPPFALGLGAWEAYDVSQNPDLTDAARKAEYARIGGGTTGGLTGAAIGGGIGALFGGFGAVPGAFIGGTLGDWAGRELAGSKIVIENILHLDGREVARSVNEQNSRDGRRQ